MGTDFAANCAMLVEYESSLRQTADDLCWPNIGRQTDPSVDHGFNDFENLLVQSVPDYHPIQPSGRIVTPANSGSFHFRSTDFSPTGHRDRSSQTSRSTDGEAPDRICRCRNHTDDCDSKQYTERSQICLTCRGYFSWSLNAISFITVTTDREILCCCSCTVVLAGRIETSLTPGSVSAVMAGSLSLTKQTI